jgi:homocysteine S-methyltransferase
MAPGFHRPRTRLCEGAVVERLRREAPGRLHSVLWNGACLLDAEGRRALAAIQREYLVIALEAGLRPLLLTATWRADGGRLQAAGAPPLAEFSARAVEFLRTLAHETAPGMAVDIGGLLGPAGDAYRPGEALDEETAARHHRPQAEALAAAGADLLLAQTLPALSEALGLARALAAAAAPRGLEVAVSLVLRPDGCLLDAVPLPEALRRLQEAAPAAQVWANCVHPRPAAAALAIHDPWTAGQPRLSGLQANGSALSPEDLDGRAELDQDDPEAWAEAMAELARVRDLGTLGGCCGTDARHLRALARRLAAD